MIWDLFWRANEYTKAATQKVPILSELSEAAAETTVAGGRITAFLTRLAAYFAVTEVRTRFMTLAQSQNYLANKVSSQSTLMLRDFDFKVKAYGFTEEMRDKTFLMVGNHMSYMDVFLLASIKPTLFVTSVDMGETPVLGHITRQAGCIFVERRNRTTIEKDVIQITEALKAGTSVTIYPEGTSSDGQRILPFKKALLTSAIEAGVDVLPVVLKYVEIDGGPFTNETKDKIAWYGDTPFTGHFLQLMATRSLKAEIHFLEPIRVTKESTRFDLAEKAENAIRECYMDGRPTPPDGVDFSSTATRGFDSGAQA